MTHIVRIPMKDGSQREVSPLTPAAIVAMGEALYESRRAQLVRDLDDAGLSPDQRLKELQELSRTRGVVSIVVRNMFTLEGAMDAMGRAGVDPDEVDVSAMDFPEIALRLLGEEPKEPDPKDAKPGNPPSGGENTPATGSESPA